LQSALDIPLYHHERWDGNGYPKRLAGDKIHIAARLFSIIDVWDTLRSDRPYRKGWPEDKVRQYINDMATRQFDPDLADKFLKLLEGGSRKRADTETNSHHTYLEKNFIV
jgi:HD-GYP domain-containing protein (c-di-GMP phosphodiesterase class II)